VNNHENHLRPPEWIHSGRALLPSRKGRLIDDHRRNDLWRLSCVMYRYLYGRFPFCIDTPGEDIKDQVRHGDLKVSSDFTQDCADAFLAMFEQNPKSRGKTEDLATLPWLSGYYPDTGHEFQNYLPRPVVPRGYSHIGIGGQPPPAAVHHFSVNCYGNMITSDYNSLYRCFAEWEFQDERRWVDIKVNALIYYLQFMNGHSKDIPPEDSAAQRKVYMDIEREIPYDIKRYLEDHSLAPPMRIIRILADSIKCQAVVVTSGYPLIQVYGNVHDKAPPKVFQIHLYRDAKRDDLFDLVMLYNNNSSDWYHYHTVPGWDVRLDADHRVNVERRARRTSAQQSGSTILSGMSQSFYRDLYS
jgi:hypothetical protein